MEGSSGALSASRARSVGPPRLWGAVGAGAGRACPGGPRRSAASSVRCGPVPLGPRPLPSPLRLPGGAGGCGGGAQDTLAALAPQSGVGLSPCRHHRTPLFLLAPEAPRSGVLPCFKPRSLLLSVTLPHSTSDAGLRDFCCLNCVKSQEIFPRK